MLERLWLQVALVLVLVLEFLRLDGSEDEDEDEVLGRFGNIGGYKTI
jgi:hypothetical protein